MINQDVVIGKYTIETLTNGMYATPLDLYREYIQNAVDSIDERIIKTNDPDEDLHINIMIDPEKNTIIISDNGCGIEKSIARQRLVDIGNSTKKRGETRGFRGIGRLSGLGYCDSLVFTTSSSGEDIKTVVTFDAKKLRTLLMDRLESENANDVLVQVITVQYLPEKTSLHYFEVKLIGVADTKKLIDSQLVRDYLIQNAPLRFAKGFKWQDEILEKFKRLGYAIPQYRITLNGEDLFKSYSDSFVSDRARRNLDSIQDIEVLPLTVDNKLKAILWCAKTNYFGTVIDNSIKGIRIRQGNILIGSKYSCNQYFKEERFNGWLIGEMHIIDSDLIVNARRDDFERNESFYRFEESIRDWTLVKTKEIRKLSYSRSLSAEKKSIVEADSFQKVDSILSDSERSINSIRESDMLDVSESEDVAKTDYINKLAALINQKKNHTKYTALNINDRLTLEQRRVLEKVFDLLLLKYPQKKADEIISYILENF